MILKKKCKNCKTEFKFSKKRILKIDLFDSFPEAYERTKTDDNRYNRFRIGIFCPFCFNFILIKDKMSSHYLKGFDYDIMSKNEYLAVYPKGE